MNEVLIVCCTFPEVALARQIGTTLVEKQLAACVNLIPAVESIYRWHGRLENSSEVLAIFKTSAATYPDLERELAKLHPYDVPEIVAIQPTAVAASYRAWVLESLTPPD